MEIGVVTFAETTAQPSTAAVPHAQRLREVVEEAEPADQVGLDVYDELFAEKLDLLLAVRSAATSGTPLTWSGHHRPALEGATFHPRPVQDRLPVRVGVGGNPRSVVRAAEKDLPLVLAIIGGAPVRSAPLADPYRRAHRELHPTAAAVPPIAVDQHGFVAATSRGARATAFPVVAARMTATGRERGGPYGRAALDAATSPSGSFVAGSPQEVVEKVLAQQAVLGAQRFMVHVSVGTLPHAEVMRAIELLGTEVAPAVRAAVAAGAVAA